MRFQGIGFMGAALALHLAIPALARVAPRWEPPFLARSSGAGRVQAIEIEVDPPPPPVARSAREAAPRVEPDARDPRIVPPERDPAPDLPPEPAPTTAPTATAAPGTAPAAGDGYDRPPEDDRGIVTAPGGVPVWAMQGVLPDRTALPAPAPTSVAAAPGTDRNIAGKVLGATMGAQDRKLGLELPGAGTVASRIAEAVRGSDAPAVARATFQVRLSAGGTVTSVRAVSWTAGTADSWQRTAGEAASRLAGFTLAMNGSFASGAWVTVQINSALTLPSGSGGRGVKAGGSPSTVGGGFAFDLSDVGAKPHRVVSSSYQVSPAS